MLLTPAETFNRVNAYIYNRDVVSANFRELFTLQFNQWTKHPKSKRQLWPLSTLDIDHQKFKTAQEMYDFNAAIVESYYQRHPEERKPV